MLWMVATVSALGGYGDPVAGVPDAESRQLATWVNAVRTDPEAFEAEYNTGGCSYYTDFSAAEQTAQTPYRLHEGLWASTRAHNDDMLLNNFFAHESFDGTAWSVRVTAFYANWTALAENIATQFGSPDPRAMVTETWMCSNAGHRASIMSSVYEDMGAAFGASGTDLKGTLNFATGAGGTFGRMRVGSHEPTEPVVGVDLRVDWTDVAAPDRIEVVLDGEALPLQLEVGTADNGLYHVGASLDASACHRYFFEAERVGVVTRWPETGSYGWGTCTFADAGAGWLDTQVGPVTSSQSSASWAPGSAVTLTVTGAVPGETVVFLRGSNGGPGPCPAQVAGTCLDIGGTVRLLGQVVADGSGEAILGFTVPASAPSGFTVHHQAVVSDGVGNWTTVPALTASIP